MNIVLVHGAWADGSSWRGVIGRLQQAGHTVAAPQFPLTTLADNVARLRQVLALQDGPTVVAAHSYGGQIMTALGADAPNVVGLVHSSEHAKERCLAGAGRTDDGEELAPSDVEGNVLEHPPFAMLVRQRDRNRAADEDAFCAILANRARVLSFPARASSAYPGSRQ